MKGMMRIWLAMAVLLMVGACRESRVEQWLMCAEGCMETNPDSAYRCLQQIDVSDGLSDEQRARYALLRTQAMHKCRIPLESDSLINVAVAYYADSGDCHWLALSLLYKGLVHKQCGEVTQAVEAFVASEQTFEGVEDNQYKALLFNHYAALLMKQNMFEEALEYFKQSYKCNLMGDSLHYVVSACGQIANSYKILNMPDSAEVYYERGLSHARTLSRRQYYYALLQNYGSFLLQKGELDKAEKIFKDCESETPSEICGSIYSALTTLYYEKGELDKALAYGKQIVTNEDSLMVCAGYLHMYKIYKGMGETDSAFHYHNLYRQYNSDITMRRKTAEIAAIPHRMKMAEMAKENHTLTGWRIWLVVMIVAITAASVYVFKKVRFRHRQEQQAKVRELEAADKKLADASVELGQLKETLTHQVDANIRMEEEHKVVLGKASAELGRLKGALTNHVEAVGRLKEEHRKQLDKHHEEIKRLRDSIDKLNADVKELKTKERERKHSEKEQTQMIADLGKQLKEQAAKLECVEHQRETDFRIDHFVMHGRDAIAVDMLLQLRYGEEVQARYDIRPSEYLPMLKELLEQENPALAERLDRCGLERKKLTMCYLIALGLDDVEMMSRAACLSVNSVKTYRRECREVIEAPSNSLKGGEKNEERLSLTLPVREGTKLQNPPIVNSKN